MGNSAPYYVYVYRDESGVPFYVGLGKGDRAMQHINRAHWKSATKTNPHKVYKIRQMLAAGLEPSVEIVAKDLTLDCAASLEIELIKRYGRRDIGTGSLTNLTDGGEGRLNFVATPEYRSKMSKSTSGERNGRYGKPVGEKTRQAIGASNTGKKRTPEQRAAISKRQLADGGPFLGKSHGAAARKTIKENRALQKMPCKAYEFVSPDGIKHYVEDGFDKFCKKHSLSRSKMMRSIGVGKVQSFTGNNMTTKETLNCIGWSVRKIEGGD